MSDWNKSDTISMLKVLLFFAGIAVLSCFAFRSYSKDPNSYFQLRKRAEERSEQIDKRLDRIEQKIDLILENYNE